METRLQLCSLSFSAFLWKGWELGYRRTTFPQEMETFSEILALSLSFVLHSGLLSFWAGWAFSQGSILKSFLKGVALVLVVGSYSKLKL